MAHCSNFNFITILLILAVFISGWGTFSDSVINLHCHKKNQMEVYVKGRCWTFILAARGWITQCSHVMQHLIRGGQGWEEWDSWCLLIQKFDKFWSTIWLFFMTHYWKVHSCFPHSSPFSFISATLREMATHCHSPASPLLWSTDLICKKLHVFFDYLTPTWLTKEAGGHYPSIWCGESHPCN